MSQFTVTNLRVGSTPQEVITSARVLQNVTANASIITGGNLAFARLPIGSGSWDVGSGNTLTLTRATIFSAGAVLAATQKLHLDGSTVGDTYISEHIANRLEIVAGGIRVFDIRSDLFYTSVRSVDLAPATAIAGSALSAGNFSWHLNEAGNTLTVTVKYSDNSVKSGTVALA